MNPTLAQLYDAKIAAQYHYERLLAHRALGQRDAYLAWQRAEAAWIQAEQRDQEDREAEVSIWIRLATIVGFLLIGAIAVVGMFCRG